MGRVLSAVDVLPKNKNTFTEVFFLRNWNVYSTFVPGIIH